ncbi:MAG TPA: hypothetical protein VGP33_12215 [Chloroflexota bacterium]|nr:hypothetical protein [Chloroflexota bacterium]
MQHLRTRLSLTLVLGALLLLPATTTALAASELPLAAGGIHTLVGDSAGTVDTYNFTVPPATAAPVLTATFTPANLADGNQAGFVVRLDGTQVGTGQATAPGVMEYTLPHSPAGIVSVQVFSYSATPLRFTIQATGVPATVANGPATNNTSATQPAPLNGSLSENLPAAPGGTFAYFGFPSPGSSPPPSVLLGYSPADARVNQAVGFNVLDAYGNTIASATQPNGQNLPAASLSVDLSRSVGEPLAIQVFNYAPGVQITYRLSVSGIAPSFAAVPAAGIPAVLPPAAGTSSAGFQPFWVENFVTTSIWSGLDAAAINFGNQPQFSSFLVVKAQNGSRLYVFNPRSGNFGYVDAAAVGPSGPPAR